MLFDLLPHLSRLVPMAERFLATRGAREQEEQAALSALTATLLPELGRIGEAHAGVQQALGEQAVQVSAVAVEVTRVRLGVEAMEARIGVLERGLEGWQDAAELSRKAAARMGVLFGAVVFLLVGVLVALGMLLIRSGGR